MSTPAISVIIPAYNAERTILDTIYSVLAQTFANFELIVINDGSTDQTPELVCSVQDPRLKLFNYENAGLSTARNRGIERSIGQYISFLDADDQWTTDKLELQLKALQQNPQAGVAYSWTTYIDEQGKILSSGEPAFYQGNVHRDLLIKNIIVNGSNVLLKREVVERVGGFDPNISACEDWEYWLRIAPYFEFVVVPKPQIFYRLSSTTLSSKIDKMEKYHLSVLEKAFQAAPPHLQYLKPQAMSELYWFIAQLALTRNEKGVQVALSRQKLWQAVQSYPNIVFQRKTQVLLVKLLIFQLLPLTIARSILKSKRRAARTSLL